MAIRHFSPEVIAAVLAIKGVTWLVAGYYKLKSARRNARVEASDFGMVSSFRAADEEYIATVEYKTRSGEKKRLAWTCDTEPSLGQSVALRPIKTGSDQMEIAESGDSTSGASFCFGVGAAVIVAAVLFIL
jgi:hypothetical protein